MAISRIGTDGIDQTSSQQIGGISVGRGGGAVSTNTAVGASALAANTTGSLNTSVGYQAGYTNTTGVAVTAFGYQAAYSGSTTNYTHAFGFQAAYTATGEHNAAFGNQALYLTTTGAYNTAIGNLSLRSNTTGIENTAVGYQALNANTNASYNTAIGRNALVSCTTGTHNTVIGHNSGDTITTGIKNTILGRYNGNQGGLDIRTASNYIVLSDGDGNPRGVFDDSGNFRINTTSSTIYRGNRAYFNVSAGTASAANFVSTSAGQQTLGIWNQADSGTRYFIEFSSSSGNGTTVGFITSNGTGTTYGTASDYRLKENISPMTGALAKVAQLKPVTYTWKADGSSGEGFIAHELQAVVPDAVTGQKDAVDEDGNPKYQGIDTSFLVATLTAAIQELKAEFDAYKEAHP